MGYDEWDDGVSAWIIDTEGLFPFSVPFNARHTFLITFNAIPQMVAR